MDDGTSHKPHPIIIAAAWGLGGLGVIYQLHHLKKGVTAMETQHWIMLSVILIAGYVLGRLWATPARMVGLP